MRKDKGLIIVYTGKGKGKTTAALGLALRAAGWKFKVLMIQFIKGRWPTGECSCAKELKPYFEIIPKGRGKLFIFKEKETQEVKKAWEFSKEIIFSHKYALIILDEINNVIKYGFLKVDEVLEVLKNKPKNLTLVLTGRSAHQKIIKLADLVTEMKEIKHPFKKGIRAIKGIEF